MEMGRVLFLLDRKSLPLGGDCAVLPLPFISTLPPASYQNCLGSSSQANIVSRGLD